MPWVYSNTARTALCSLTHLSGSTRRLSLQCSAFLAGTDSSSIDLQLSYGRNHSLKSRRIPTHRPHSQSTRSLSTILLLKPARLISRFVSPIKLSQYQISTTRSVSVPTLAAEQLRNRDEPTLSLDASTLTPAQTSRAARQAVYLALQDQICGWQDALHIVNSLHYPILKQDPDATVTSYPAITFDQPVSPRLASHALVHGLIRQDQLKHAANLTLAMMQCGMRVRSQTLNIVMQSLKPRHPEQSIFKATLSRRFRPDPKNFSDLAKMATHTSTRFALEIFVVARRTGQGNMQGLLSTLLAICLINTEIILASFVFVMVVKEFYHPPPSPEGDTTESTWNAEKYGPRTLVFLPRFSHFNDLIVPMRNYFRHVSTLNTTSDQFDQESFEAHLQAVAILANLLDLRQLHLPLISPLLTLMYHTPRTSSMVWVQDEDGDMHQVVAFQYFHDVLVRLIENPPAVGKKTKNQCCCAFTPALGLETCNTLLHYALRHCHSPILGNKVLVYLTQARKLTPDETTYNVLLRSGTLLRNNDLASLALTAMANSKAYQKPPRPQSEHNVDVVSPLQVLSNSKSEMVRHTASVIETINTINNGMMSPSRLVKVKHALYMLNTLMMHICSTGHPHLVKPIMFALFPILDRNPSVSPDKHMFRRRKAIKHATRFGPLLFTVLLNALVKARALAEARLLYNFAVAAERRSWFTHEPWTLGIEVYTIMLDLCAAECREAARLQSIPAAVAKDKPRMLRKKATRLVYRLYKRLNKVPYTSHNTMRRYDRLKHFHKLVLPKRDERFSSALVRVLVILSKYINPANIAIPDVVVQHRHPRPRTQMKLSADSVAKKYTQTQQTMVDDHSYLPSGWSHQLHYVGRGMILAGMNLPPALRHLFLGRDDMAAIPANKKLSLKVVPWAYATEKKKEAWHPWIVPSIRTRGLVTKRMTRAQRARIGRKRMRK